MKFEELKLQEEILKAIAEFGYTELTPIQEKTIPLLLEGKDVVAEAPTGTGKTCAYALPIINNVDKEDKSVQALILCPTRELAIQIVKEIRNYYKYKEGCSSLPIYGGQAISRQIMLLKKHPNIIVGTPGRILDHLSRKTIRLDNLKTLVLDECDEMLDMGFRPDIDTIVNYIKSEHQTMLFSATISDDIKKISKSYQKEDKVSIKAERVEEFNKQIHQFAIKCSEDEKKRSLTKLLNTINYKKIFIFCRTKRKVDHLTSILNQMAFDVLSIHGDMSQRQRDCAMMDFRTSPSSILVATDIAARGLDVGDVDVVINYDLPDEDEFYLHRIGRTGRAKKEGSAYTFFTKKQMSLVSKFEKMTNDKIVLYTLPTTKEENEIMAKKNLEDIKQDVLNENLDEYQQYIKDFIAEAETDGNNVSALQVAAALLKNFSKKSSIETVLANDSDNKNKTDKKDRRSDRRVSKFEESDVNENTKRLFLNVGEMDGFSNRSLTNFVKDTCGITDDNIVDVYVKDSFSFVEINNVVADLVMMQLNSQVVGDRQVNAELSEKKPSRGERRQMRDSKEKKYGDKKSFGDKKSYGDRKSYGDKKSFGDKKSSDNKKSFGGRGRTSYARKDSEDDSTETKKSFFGRRDYSKRDSSSRERKSFGRDNKSSHGGRRSSFGNKKARD